MDDQPFFTFDLDSYRKSDLKNLTPFQKSDFSLDRIAAQAGTLKLQGQVMGELRKEFTEPTEEFVRMIANRLHDGRLTEGVRNRYQQVIATSIAALIRDSVNDRLQSAMSQPEDEATAELADVDFEEIETTQVEIDGYNIIRAIGSQLVAADRIGIRDAKSYCAVLLDDNNRRTIARLHFNSDTSRYLGVFEGKAEERRSISTPVEIYSHADAILARIRELEG